MWLMLNTICLQYAEIARLNRNIESMNHKIRKKDEELVNLREHLSKYEKPGKNSWTAATLSKKSMKDVVVRRTKILLKPRGKKPNG